MATRQRTESGDQEEVQLETDRPCSGTLVPAWCVRHHAGGKLSAQHGDGRGMIRPSRKW